MAQSAAENLAAIYAEAEKRLSEMMLHPNGGAPLKEFDKARLASLLAEVRKIQRELKQQAAKITGDQIGASYRQGLKDAAQQAEEAGIRPEGSINQGSFSIVDRHALQIIARDTAGDLYKGADAMANVAQRALRATAQAKLSEADINKIVARGIIDGDPTATMRQLAADLQRAHGGGILAIPTKSGGVIHFDAGYYAKLVILTKTREAVVKGTINRLRETKIYLVSIIGRVSKNFCTAFLGKVFYIGDGQHPKYPHFNTLPGDGPPFHPQCSKSVRAFIEALATENQKKIGEGIADAEKLLKQSPTDKPISQAEAQRAYKDLQMRQQIDAQRSKLIDLSPSIDKAIAAVEDQAKRLGVEKIDIRPNIEVGRKVVNALETAKRAKLQIPEQVSLDGDGPAAEMKGKHLRIDHTAETWKQSTPRLEVLRAISAAEFLASATPATRKQLQRWNASADRAIAAKLSAAAANSPADFLIEVRAARAAGIKLPAEITALYGRLT